MTGNWRRRFSRVALTATLFLKLGNSMAADINSLGPNGQPIIHYYIESYEHDKVDAWIKAGGNTEVRDQMGATPMLMAAEVDDWIAVEMLLEAGADPSSTSDTGMTLPFLAETSRVDTAGPHGEPYERVKAALTARGLMVTVYPPKMVQTLRAQGKWQESR